MGWCCCASLFRAPSKDKIDRPLTLWRSNWQTEEAGSWDVGQSVSSVRTRINTHTPGVILACAENKRRHALLWEIEGALRHCFRLQTSYKHRAVGLWVWTGRTHAHSHSWCMLSIIARKQKLNWGHKHPRLSEWHQPMSCTEYEVHTKHRLTETIHFRLQS